MGRSYQLGVFAGIPVKVHWSFGLLVLFFMYVIVNSAESTNEIIYTFLLFIILFVCVILHEFGHALTGKYFKVGTRDIIISPIGGVARLEKLPKAPREELLIAIAGPLVNVVIASLCFIGLFSSLGITAIDIDPETARVDTAAKFFKTIFYINVVLFLFNLIPAFPMDGGRILRALLSFKLSRTRSTMIASTIGKIFALFFIGYGLYIGHYVLAFIGGFIFYMATTENKQVRMEESLSNTPVSDIMRPTFQTMYLHDRMSKPIALSMTNQERNFLVADLDGKFVGTLHHLFIKDAIQQNRQDETVSTYTSPKLICLSPDISVNDVRNMMNKDGLSIVMIGHSKDDILGVVDRDGIINFMNLSA